MKILYIKNYKKIPGTIVLISFAIICCCMGSFSFENSFAHNFSPDESAHFLTLVDKIKVESELAANSTGDNNTNNKSLAKYMLIMLF